MAQWGCACHQNRRMRCAVLPRPWVLHSLATSSSSHSSRISLHLLLHFFHFLEGKSNTSYFAMKKMNFTDESYSHTDMGPRTTTSWKLMSIPSQSPWPTHSFPTNGSWRLWITMTPRWRRCFITHTEYTLWLPARRLVCLSVVVVRVRAYGAIQLESEQGDLFGLIGHVLNVGNAQIRTLLDKQKEQILAECQAEIKINEYQANYDQRIVQKLSDIIESQQKELHCAQAEKLQRRDQQLLHAQFFTAISEIREAYFKSVDETEELKKSQGSIFDTIARTRLIEYQNTVLELIGKRRELQMKWIARIIQEIFKMLNQHAVDIPTLPVVQCFAHTIEFLMDRWAVL